jgi:predicted nucleotidyltransferase
LFETMNSDEIAAILRAAKDSLWREYGVRALWLFGPAARRDTGSIGEIDVMLELDEPPEVRRFMALRLRLEALFDGAKVEPVLRPRELPEGIDDPLTDAIRVF